jgi:hypothetical protein
MKSSLLLGIAAAALCHAEAMAQQSSTTSTPVPASTPRIRPVDAPEIAPAGSWDGGQLLVSPPNPGLKLRGGATFTGLSGFWDYQSNGMLRGRIFMSKDDSKKLYVATMTAADSTDTLTISKTRRVGFAYSNDGGASWTSSNNVTGTFRTGYPYILVTPEGVPYLALHGEPDANGARSMIYTGSANSTTFTKTAEFTRESLSGRTGEGGAGVIWPAIALSPKDPTQQVVAATLSYATGEQPDPIHLSVAPLGGRTEWDFLTDATTGTSSGGRNIFATSASGKLGMAYVHFDSENGSGIYFSESTDGGKTWSTPVRTVNRSTYINTEGGGANDDQDTIFTGGTFDFYYNGDDPQIVTAGNTNGLFASQSIYYWNGAGGLRRIAGEDSTIALGLIRAVITKTQPNMDFVDYPQLVVGDDGQHIAVVFQAAAQTSSETNDQVTSPDGFYYYRLWAVGSPDGGVTWSQPRIIQDFAGDNTDSATIEYPTTPGFGHVTANSLELSVAYQAKRFPGMYSNTIVDIDANTDGDQPSDRGPFSETGMYFQRTTLDPTFFGQPASVDNGEIAASGMAFKRSYPNPANGAFTVEYTLATRGEVSLKVFNSLGQEVLAPISGEQGYAGEYRKGIDVGALQSGAYRVVLSQNGRTISQPLNIVR